MNLSDPSDEESSSDGTAKKRQRVDTTGASSTTSQGSGVQDSDEESSVPYVEHESSKRPLSDDEHSDPTHYNIDNTRHHVNYNERSPPEDITGAQESDEEPSFSAQYISNDHTRLKRLHSNDDTSDVGNTDQRLKRQRVNYKNRPSGNIRLSRSSLSETCSSEDYRPGLEEHDIETPTEEMRPHFQDPMERFYDKSSDQDSNSDRASMNPGYSDISKRMMVTMGYKSGKGLGKFEHGIVEPVEASTQKGRRGLGLKPSAVSDVPRDFKWEPDCKKPEATEKVSWMPPAPDVLSGDQLDKWLQKGPKKLTLKDESEFVDPQILDGVVNAKNIFDTLEDEDLRRARFRSNPYETIGSVIFLNRAAVKMANMDAVFDFMFTNPKQQNGESAIDYKKDILYFADVCAGPGGFSEYVLYRRGWKAKGFGFTLKGQCDFKLSDFYVGSPETFNPYYGINEDGNIFDPENLTSLKFHVLKHTNQKGVHFLMADGGFSVEGQENIQEILSKQLYLCQCLAALMLVRTGGHFVVKLFDVFTPFSVGLIYIMHTCFDRVSIHKPVTSRPANSERYLICQGKRLGSEPAERHLYNVNQFLWKNRDNTDVDITELVSRTVLKEDTNFYNYMYNSNCVIGENQIQNLLKIAAFSKDYTLKEESQAEMREKCLKLWQLPDAVRTQPERMNPDDTLACILSLIKKRLPESHNLQAIKANVLGKQPQLLDSVDNLKLFKSVYDWHFVFLNSVTDKSDLRFFLGCGNKRVYQLEGTRWKDVVDLHLTMPAKTLIYGEVVKELCGEGNNQIHTKALHVIDALVLGGKDISCLSLSERLNQCALFCIALEKPFETQALPLRCKQLFNMENFSTVMNKLEFRVTKRVRRAVTIKVPNRTSNEEMFHVIGSILFIKEIKEPWESKMSRSSGFKYYFSPSCKRSEYYIPSEACMDTFSSFTSRVLWPWDPAGPIFEKLPHSGLTRTQMEEYIQQNK